MASAYRKRQLRNRAIPLSIATLPPYRPLAVRLVRLLPPPVSLSYSDLRRYNPTASVSRPFSFRRPAARLVDRTPVRSVVSRPVIAFQQPRSVHLCQRRKTRRQVLLAKGHGGSGNRKPRWNKWSYVSC